MIDKLKRQPAHEPEKVSEGKTKVLTRYPNNQDQELVKVTTKDSLTGNDGELKSELPLAKAKTIQTCNIFNILKTYGIPCAYKGRGWSGKGTSDREFIAQNCKMLPLECVLRRRPWGSYLKRHPIEDPKNTIFKSPIAEFYLKVVDKPFTNTHTESHDEVTANIKYTTYTTKKDIQKYSDPIIYFHNLPWSLNLPWHNQPSFESSSPYVAYGGKYTHTVHTHEYMYPKSDWYIHPPKMQFSPSNMMKLEPPIADYETMQYIEHELMRPTFRVIEDLWRKFDVSLIDLKIEVGYSIKDNELVIADVIDNDSWRIWPEGDPTKQLDKQLFREGGDEDDVVSNYEKVADYTHQMKEWFYRI